MDFSRLSRNLYNETTSDEFTSDSSAGSGDDDDDDEDDDDENEDNYGNNGAKHNRKKKSVKKNIFSTFHEECDLDDVKSRNILLKLFQRERTGYMSGGFMSKRNRTAFDKVPSRLSFCLKNIVPYCFLQCHMFMGLTACGQFLVSYKVCYDENSWAANNYNFSSYYKYTLYFWIYRPHQPLGKFFKTCLFDDHGVDNLKAVSMTQWITNPRILVVHGASEHENEDSYITIVRVPKLGCLDCKKLMETEGDGSYFRGDALCIKCNLTIHTKYSTTESDPKFNPHMNLISPERIIIVANGFIHILHVELEIQNQSTNHTSLNQQQQQHLHQQQQNQFLCYSTKDTINSIQQKDDKTATDVANQCDKKTQWLPSLNYNSSSNNNNNSNNSNSINNNSNVINGSNSSSTNENGCDNNDNIVARIIADFSEFENESQMAISCNNEKLSSGFCAPDINHRNSKNYDELIFTCGSNTPTYASSSSINGLSGKQTTTNSSDSGSHSKVNLLNHSKGKRNQRIVTKSYRNGITTVDLQGSSNVESTISDDKASAYEFSEDNEKCEKIGIFRKRRLADKKYEFSEDNSENIVPFHKSRILSQGARTRLHRTLPSSHHHPIYVSASSTQTYETTTHHHRASPSQGFRSPCGSPVGSSRFLRSPSKNNSTCSSMQQLQQLPSCSYQQQHQQQQQQQIMTVKPLNTLSPRQLSAAIKTHFETPIVGGNMSPIAPFLSPRRESPFENKVYEVSLSAEGQEKPTCIKKLKRRYVEEDDATSVITSEEDDCIFPGYHTSLPMEVHGSCYSDMQMISNASYQKLKCPTVIITQHSFDLETFTYYVISNLCQKNNKTYDVFYDWACELVNVCPHSNSITCILMAHFTARDQLLNNSTKCLNCSRNIDCVFHRRQFECRILFTWNMELGDWDVLDYGNMNEVPSNNNKKSIIGLNKIAKTLASELSDNINKIHNYSYNLRVLDSNIDKSKESLIDLDNCIRFYRKKPRFSSCDTLTDN